MQDAHTASTPIIPSRSTFGTKSLKNPSRFAVRLSSPPAAFITLPVAVPPGLL
jgi:hypothetical protein